MVNKGSKSKSKTQKEIKKEETVSALKKKILDLKDDLQKSKRETKFLKESLLKIKAPSQKKGIFSSAKKAFNNASTAQKLGALATGVVGTGASLAFLANLAKQELDRRNSISPNPDSPVITMESINSSPVLGTPPPSPKFQPSGSTQDKPNLFSRIGNAFSGATKPINF
jgi:hypothetical protein